MQAEQRLAVIARQTPVLARGIHDAACSVGLGDRVDGVGADRRRQHGIDAQLGDDAEQHGIDASRVGIGQLGQIPYSHHDLDVRVFLAQTLVTHDGGRQAERDGIENSVGNERPTLFLHRIDGAIK